MDKQVQEILDRWTPQPLTPKIDEEKYKNILNPTIVSSRPGKYIRVNGRDCLNLATNDFLGLSCDESLDKAAIDGEPIHELYSRDLDHRNFYYNF